MKASQAIRNAVEAERAAAKFYTYLASSTTEPDAKAMLEMMARVETEHADAIDRVGRDVLGGPLAERANADLTMVETLPEWRFVEGITLEQAAEIALACERQAALFYDALSDCFDGEVRAFFLDLARTEEEHATALTLGHVRRRRTK